MSVQEEYRVDEDLQAIAETVLAEAGFATAIVPSDRGCLLAENEYSILAVVAVR